MKELKVTLKGTTPLLMHACRTVNPLHPLNVGVSGNRGIKYYTGLRKKSEEDYRIISDLEFLSSLYYTEDITNPFPNGLRDDMRVYLPGDNVQKAIQVGAQASKKGKDIQKFVTVVDFECAFDFGESKTVAQLLADYRFRDVRTMVVQRNRIARTRARFDRWATEFTLQYEDTMIDVDTLVNAIEYAGSYVGLCDSRPKYGQFVAVIEG